MDTRKVENRGIDQEIFDIICTAYPDVPYFHSLENLCMVWLGKGQARLRMEPELKYTTQDWRLHGGVVATLLDIAMHAAIHTLGLLCLTLDMNITYLSPAISSEGLDIEGKVLKAGKTVAMAEANLYDEQGRLLATGRGTFTTRPARPGTV